MQGQGNELEVNLLIMGSLEVSVRWAEMRKARS